MLDSAITESWEPPWVPEISRRQSFSQYRGSQDARGSNRLRDTDLHIQSLHRSDLTGRLGFSLPETKDLFATGISMGAPKNLDLAGRNASLLRFTAKLQSAQRGSKSEQVAESGAPMKIAGKPGHTTGNTSTQTSNVAMPIDLPLQLPLDVRTVSKVDAVANERSQLLARKHGGQRLSLGEQERLEVLTSRLKELLPPVSLSELEALLEMAEEAERIRERARERRRRLGLS